MKILRIIIGTLFTVSLTVPVLSMSKVSHEQTVNMALDILQKGSEKQRWVYGFFSYHASRNGTSPQATIAANGPSPDFFLDTIIGGWWMGYRYFFELQFFGGGGYTSYWHFTSAFRPGKMGDRYSGFAYPMAPDDGFFGLNTIPKTVLHNAEIKSGSYENARGLVVGVKDLFQIITGDWLGLLKDVYFGEKHGGFGMPGAPDVLADYQTQTASTNPDINGQKKNGSWRVPASNWDDIQDTYFNPGANAGQFWYNQFTHNSTFDDIQQAQLDQLGYAMHWIADGSTPQHVWSTTDHHHSAFEKYMDEHISSKGWKADPDKVQELLAGFQASSLKTYAQQFSRAQDLDSNNAPIAAVTEITGDGVAIKDLQVKGKVDPTLYSAGDILRWLAEQAVQMEEVLTDDSEETFNRRASDALTLAVAGEILLMEKAAADLYKAKQYARVMKAQGSSAEIWGNGVFCSNGGDPTASCGAPGHLKNQIR